MNRAVLALFALILAAAMLVPALALATEAAPASPAATPVTTAATPVDTAATPNLISYPEPKPDATAAEAKAEAEWHKPGDGMNLIFALVGLGGIFGIIAWGIVASRRAAAY